MLKKKALIIGGSEAPLLKTTIFRPGHIYGPGFLLGCFPENSRQAELPEHILEGKPLKLLRIGLTMNILAGLWVYLL